MRSLIAVDSCFLAIAVTLGDFIRNSGSSSVEETPVVVETHSTWEQASSMWSTASSSRARRSLCWMRRSRSAANSGRKAPSLVPVVVSLRRPLERVLREAVADDARPAAELGDCRQLQHGHGLLQYALRLLVQLLLMLHAPTREGFRRRRSLPALPCRARVLRTSVRGSKVQMTSSVTTFAMRCQCNVIWVRQCGTCRSGVRVLSTIPTLGAGFVKCSIKILPAFGLVLQLPCCLGLG